MDGVIRMSAGLAPAENCLLVPLATTGKFVLSVSDDQVRPVTQPVAGGWTVVDVSTPAGGFSFTPLSRVTAARGPAREMTPEPGATASMIQATASRSTRSLSSSQRSTRPPTRSPTASR